MATNILTKSKVERQYNMKIMGSNKLSYVPYTSNLAGDVIDYFDNKLKQSSIISVSYDVASGKFPEEKLAQALSPSTTELAQASATQLEFSYHRQPSQVEFTLSNMQEVNDVNINAGILNRMLMQYDYEHFHGSYGNVGMFNNPNSIQLDTTAVATDDLASIITLIDALLTEMAVNYGIRESEYPNITLSYTSDVAAIIRKPITTAGGNIVTGKTTIQSTYGGMDHQEVPPVLGIESHISLAYRPGINNHRAALPSLYSTANGDAHGLTKKNLFVYDCAANEIEGKGAYVYQKVTTPASRAKKEKK
ncbi:hypothetical protein IHC92_20725 [Photobacterium damselae subsp. damselae]|uniref:hypothetical protein n=1 Tax=Photobacterium damselae TaxID=38293 RepID=UPI001F492638|nr:hypothetical protein [Photobacterium damselae]UKA23379.1 hypothetical protein IHC92_20725 [Photobacterium damselae subsp. damselae]